MINVNFEDLDTYLSSVSSNTLSEAYELNIQNTTEENWLSSTESDTVGSILKKYSIYVDLSNTIIPETIDDLDSVFEGCRYLVKSPTIPEIVTNLSESFRNCTSLLTTPTIPENVENMSGTFYNCTSLTSTPTIPENVTTMSYCFQGCTNIKSCKLPDSVLNINSCFKNCTSLSEVTLGNQVNQMSSTFQNCTSLITGPKIPDTVINMANCFNGCTSLTTINNISKGLTRNSNYIFKDCTSLYNGSIVRDITRIKYLYDKATIQACGMLTDSVTSTTFGDITDLKIYTTKEHYTSLKNSIETNYSDRNFSVIQVDACLDYDEISDWLFNQEENTEDTPYTIFVGGGLTSNRLQGQGWYYGNWNSSDFSSLFYKPVYVDLINLCLSKDTNQLRSSFVPVRKYGPSIPAYDTTSPYITRICEIPEQVSYLSGTFCSNTVIKGFGENNLIPDTVSVCSDPFNNTSNLNDVYIEHKIKINYSFSNDNCSYNIYAKDYSHLYSTSRNLCNNRRVILECDYTDLDTYLNWFDKSCEDVNLKCNNLTIADLTGSGTSSPLSSCEFSKKLLGINIEDSTIKNYCTASTFDLRLTDLPVELTTLSGSFNGGNISYSPVLLDTITNLNNTFNGCELKEMPDIPESVIDMSGTFGYCDFIETKKIPDSVTKLDYTFYYCSNLKTILNIPPKVTDLTKTFSRTGITEIVEIPDSVTIMNNSFEYCTKLIKIKNLPNNLEYAIATFLGCTSLTDIPNIPSAVTNLQETFANCTELKTIHGWDLDVTKDNLVLTDCFRDCPNLTTIYTTSKPATKEYSSSDLDSGWRLINVKYLSNDKYLVTCRNLKGLNSNVIIPATDLTNFYTDELLFTPRDKLSNTFIENMLDYKLPFGDGLDPSKKNFIVWATDDTAVKTNIISSLENEISELNEQINNLKNQSDTVKLIGKLTNNSTILNLSDPRIIPSMLTTVFTSEYGVSPSSVTVDNGSVTVSFEETHNEMSVGVKLENF